MNVRSRIVTVLAAASLLAGGIVTANGVAPAPHVGQRYTPHTHTCFNRPTSAHGTRAQAYSCNEEFVRSVRATPARAVIRISTYSFDIPRLEQALIAAHRRGAHVQISLWGERASAPEVVRLRRELGSGINNGSYLTACVGSCRLSGTAGIQHVKVSTISNVVGTKNQTIRWLTFIGSANYSRTNATASWNNTALFVGDRTLYSYATGYANTNRLDRTQYNYPSAGSRGYSVYFFPHSDPGYDPVLSALNATRCAAPRGTGANGRTVVRVMQYNITTSRKKIITRLTQLKEAGCDVQVIVAAINVSNSLLRALVKAGIPTYDGYIDTNHNGWKDIYPHGKTTVISGSVWGLPRNYVYAGSGNWTGNALNQNTEAVLRYTSLKAVQQHLAWFKAQRPFTRRVLASKLDAKASKDESGMDMGEVTAR